MNVQGVLAWKVLVITLVTLEPAQLGQVPVITQDMHVFPGLVRESLIAVLTSYVDRCLANDNLVDGSVVMIQNLFLHHTKTYLTLNKSWRKSQ